MIIIDLNNFEMILFYIKGGEGEKERRRES